MRDTFRINNLVVDAGFRDFILSSESRVSVILKSFDSLPDANFIGITDKLDHVSYLPGSKTELVYSEDIDPYQEGIGRVQIKVGRLVQKLLDKRIIEKYIHPSDIEIFVNEFKSFFDESKLKLRVVGGEELRSCYFVKNYSYPETGTLWKSCMRYRDRQRFLDIYVHNPEVVKMLVLFVTDEDGAEKVRARALLWEAKDLNDNKVKIMDRIYSLYDSDVHILKRWASTNGYTPKYYQNAKSQNLFEMNNEPVVMNLKVELPKHDLGTWPYLDTFQFYDMRRGVFYNNELKRYDYILIQANGRLFNDDTSESDEHDYDDYEDGPQEW